MDTSDQIKRILWNIVVPCVLVIALVVVSFWGAEQKSLAAGYQTTAQNMYRRCYLELADNLDTMEVTLEKLMVVASPSQYVLLLDDLWRLSGSSEGLLSQLPASHVDTLELNRFLVRTGDFAHALTKRVLAGGVITQEELTQLESLRVAARDTGAQLQERLERDQLPMVSLSHDEYFQSALSGEDGYQEQEGQQQYPTLIYDGPFAESVERAQPRGLTGQEVTADQARAEVERLLGIAVEYQGDSNGIIPCYEFALALENGGSADVSVTRQGGRILSFMSPAAGGKEGVGDQAESAALKDAGLAFLERLGFSEMTATYAQYYSGVAVINFAAVQEDVILYNDLVKVWMDRETGAAIGLDARNYWMSHVQRQLPGQRVAQEEAQAMVSPRLKVESVQLALIPVSPEQERLCYEFKGTFGENNYIIYINAQTLAEEQVYKILDSETGQMVL